MEKWYALRTVSGKEPEAGELLKQAVSHALWSECRIPKKTKVYRSGGRLYLLEDVMFPGYLFIKTDCPNELAKKLEKSGKLPQFIDSSKGSMAPVEDQDLRFLKVVCGDDLRRVMGVSKIVLNDEKRIIRTDGVLLHYQNQIVKLNLHKRYAVVKVDLFNRLQTVLFGISLEQDRTR